MAIPTITRTQSFQPGSVGPQASPADFGSGAAEGLAQLGNSTASVSMDMAKRQEQDENLWLQKSFAEAQLRSQQNLDDSKLKAPPGAPGFTANILGTYKKDIEGLAKAAPSDRAREKLMTMAINHQASLEHDAKFFEAQSGIKKGESDFSTTSSAITAAMIHNPGLFNEGLAQVAAAGTSLDGRTDPIRQKALIDTAKEQYALAHVQTLSDYNPRQALKNIESGMYDKLVAPDRLANEKSRMVGLVKRVNVLDADHLGRDIGAEVTNGLERGSSAFDPATRERIKNVYQDPIVQAKELEDYDRKKESTLVAYDHVGRFYDDPSVASVTKIVDDVRAFKASKPGKDSLLNEADRKNLADNLIDYMKSEADRLHKDSPAFFNNPDRYPEHSKLATIAEKLAADQNANPSAVANAKDTYYNSLNSLQEQAEILPQDRRLLSESQANLQNERIKSIIKNDPKNLRAELIRIQTQDGPDRYSQILADLREAKDGLDGRVDAAAMFIDQPFFADMVDTLAIKKEDLDLATPTEEKRADLLATIDKDPGFQDLYRSLSRNVAPSARVTYKANMKRMYADYSKFLVTRGQATDFPSAVKLTSSRFTPYTYAQAGQAGEKARIPQAVPERDKGQIIDNMGALIPMYAKSPELLASPSMKALTARMLPPEADDASRLAVAADLLEQGGFWNTSRDDKGLELWVRLDNKPDGQAMQVLDAKGKPVTHLFNQLAAPLQHQYMFNHFVKPKKQSSLLRGGGQVNPFTGTRYDEPDVVDLTAAAIKKAVPKTAEIITGKKYSAQ